MSKLDKITIRDNITSWPEFNINFWAINKNGSSTLTNHFVQTADNIKLNLNNDYGQDGKRQITFRRINREKALSNGQRNFTIVRDPCTRFESAYRQFAYRTDIVGARAARKVRFEKDWEPQDFLEYIQSKFAIRKDVNNKRFTPLSGNKHFYKQIDFLPVAIIPKLDYIVKLEDLEMNWPLAEVEPPPFISNATAPVDLKEYDKDLLYSLYEEDFINFGYTLLHYPNGTRR